MQFEVGQHAQVMIPIGEIVLPFESQVVSVDTYSFEISIPRRKVVKYPIKPGQMVSLVFATADGLMSMEASPIENLSGKLLFPVPGPQQLQVLQRREYERVPLPVPWEVTVQLDPEFGFDLMVSAQLKDLSQGGCGLWIDLGLMEGVPVRVFLERSDLGRIRLDGQVAHSMPVSAPSADSNLHRTGIRFDLLDANTQGWLQQCLDQLLEHWQTTALKGAAED